jgi:pimeloyl-ACP methyl ester carboxylesterase
MNTPTTLYLDRPEGRLSYDDNGVDGPLVIAAPGMGDLRHVYRHIRDDVAEAGVRLVAMDLRGMGDSSTGWSQLDDAAVASDYLALIDHLDAGPAVLVGNSLSCASAVLAATDAPDKVSATMLLGPFVRDVPQKWWRKAAVGAMLTPLWGKGAWVSYYRKILYPGAKPPDFDEYVDALSQNLSESGRFASFRKISGSSHAESGRRLGRITQPVVVVMGTADPDFPDPMAEANEIAGIMGADVVWSEGSGHYPQAETPDLVAGELIGLVGRVGGGGSPSRA